MTIILGADDSGRGPVIGSMILAGVTIEEKNLEELKTLGVKDSKLLTAKQRKELYPKIIGLVKDHKIIIIPAGEIDSAVESQTSNLNTLECQKFSELINALKPDIAIIDCPSNNKKAFTHQLKQMLNANPTLKCEHKADRDYPIVAAASILAKITRDKEIEKIQKKIKEHLGSGYPADPITQKFLKENWNKYPEIFRHSWSSYKVYSEGKKSKKQKTLVDY